MPIPSPNLDDRDFNSLVAEARARIDQLCPEWTDRSDSDPGMVLLDLFAYLTETMIYRLNRLPEKVYIELLNLLGVRLHPPAAARAELKFSLARAADRDVVIPRGTRVTTSRTSAGAQPPVFATTSVLTIPAGGLDVTGLALHCVQVEAEPAGTGTGLPGQRVIAAHAPIIAPTGDPLDLVVGVEALASELTPNTPAIEYDGKTYRVWREVESFTEPGPDRYVYLADRMSGTVMFAQAVQMEKPDGTLDVSVPLAEVPGANRGIMLSYRSGGGPEGNVEAGSLTVLKDPIPGVSVTNPQPATGGQTAETLDNALARGPQELHTPRRAVTAGDYEAVAIAASAGVARAHPITSAELWAHAVPGTVEVGLVPAVPGAGPAVTPEQIAANQTEATRMEVQRALDAAGTLGTTHEVTWTPCKTVAVTLRIVVRREENQVPLQQRVLDRLNQTINPLATPLSPNGWPFGQALRVSDVFDIALSEPGVKWVDHVHLKVDAVPDGDVLSVAADAHQPNTWFAGSDGTLFRSMNDGDGWEVVGSLPDEQITVVRVHPDRPGYVAVATQLADGSGSRLHASLDCGETWQPAAQTAFRVADLAWTVVDDVPALLLASDAGLHQLKLGESVVPIGVDPANAGRPFYAVVVTRPIVGGVNIAVAAQESGGVWLSSDGGRTFRLTGLQGQDIRTLAVRYDGARAFLWAGATVPAGGPGSGAFVRELLRPGQDPPEGWQPRAKNWTGGSCHALAFMAGSLVVAASHRGGIIWLDESQHDPAWNTADVQSNLPQRVLGQFSPLITVAVKPSGDLLMTGGPVDTGGATPITVGVWRNVTPGEPTVFQYCSNREFPPEKGGGIDRVTLPPTYLFCSGAHEVNVQSEDAAAGD